LDSGVRVNWQADRAPGHSVQSVELHGKSAADGLTDRHTVASVHADERPVEPLF
jgi:hypothetical protein